MRPELQNAGQPLRSSSGAGRQHRDRQIALPTAAGRHQAARASAQAQRALGAALSFDARGRDPADLARASAELWAALFIDEAARGVLRRDGLDPARLPLSGPHPFAYRPAVDGIRTR